MSRVGAAPPGRSIWDASQPAATASTAAKTVPDAQNVDIVNKAMRDMHSTARDDNQRYDLKDLLVNSSREAQYSEMPAGVRASTRAALTVRATRCWFFSARPVNTIPENVSKLQ